MIGSVNIASVTLIASAPEVPLEVPSTRETRGGTVRYPNPLNERYNIIEVAQDGGARPDIDNGNRGMHRPTLASVCKSICYRLTVAAMPPPGPPRKRHLRREPQAVDLALCLTAPSVCPASNIHFIIIRYPRILSPPCDELV